MMLFRMKIMSLSHQQCVFKLASSCKIKNPLLCWSGLRQKINIYDKFEIHPLPRTPIVNKALEDSNLAAFISFSPLYRWEISEIDCNLTEVRLIDLRYRSNDRYPFVAVAHVDEELNIVNSYTGWIYSEDKLQRKLQIGSSN